MPYAVTLAAIGGNGTYAWALIDGALPPGVSLGPTTGVLSGTPTHPGRFSITVQAQDATDPSLSGSQPYEVTIASAPPAVSLVSPLNGATLVGPEFALVASASDPDGTVTRVDFFVNGSALGSASAAPWSFAWPKVAPGTYQLTAVATDDSGLATTSAAVGVTVTLSSSGVAVPELAIASVTPSRASASTAQSVTWTVTAGGGVAPYTYQFWVYNGAEWRLGQDWSPSATWVWTPSTSGTYSFQVWARSAGSSARLDTFRSFGPFVVSQPAALTARTLAADRAGPMPARTPITWTALASGGTGPYTYQFWVWNGAAWSIGQHWSSSPTWTWIPAAPGTYVFQVWIRNAGSAASYDAYRSAGPYIIGNPIALTVRALAADRKLPVPQGTPVTWTASAAGGTGPYTYKFYVYDGVNWRVGQRWSTSPAWTWIPAAPGDYVFQVWVRNAGSTASYDAYRSAGPAVILGPSPLAVTAFAVSSAFELATGVPAVITAAAAGGSGPYTYQFWVFDGSSWTIGQSWSASSTFAWMPPAPGTYSMQVWVRNAGSTRTWDAYGSLGLGVVP